MTLPRWLPQPFSLERRRGIILMAWSAVMLHDSSLASYKGFHWLLSCLAWTGHAQVVVGVVGLLFGGLQVACEAAPCNRCRRGMAILAVAFWCLVGSSFADAAVLGPSSVLYLGLAWLNMRVARGLPLG